MRIYLGLARFIVNADLVSENFYTAWVQLFDGHFIIRRKKRDFVDFDVDKIKEFAKSIQPAKIEKVKKASFWHRLVYEIKLIIKFLTGGRKWKTITR